MDIIKNEFQNSIKMFGINWQYDRAENLNSDSPWSINQKIINQVMIVLKNGEIILR